MALVKETKDSLYNGVNLQAAEHRLETQVEESINAYPTIAQGLLKRNPTNKIPLNGAINYDDDMWVYGYDRGLAGDTEEKYSIQISKNGMEIIDIITGKVYTKGNGGLIYDKPEDENYLLPYVDRKGYSAVTIRDTTFLVNKNIQPMMNGLKYSNGSTGTQDNYGKNVQFVKYPAKEGELSDGKFNPPIKFYQKNYAPTNISRVQSGDYITGIKYTDYANGSVTQLDVDGNSVVINYQYMLLSDFPTYNEYIAELINKLSSKLDESLYDVTMVQGDTVGRQAISIKRLDGVAPVVTYQLDIHTATDDTPYASVPSDYYVNIIDSSSTDEIIVSNTYNEESYIWIKGSNPTSAYSYTFSITSVGGGTYSATVSDTTTEKVAIAVRDSINGSGLPFTAVAKGSIVQVRTTDSTRMTDCNINDTYGNQASYAWTQYVQSLQELPATMPFNTLVKVIDTENAENSNGYWLLYKDGRWEESIATDIVTEIMPSSMPHVIVRNIDDTFTFKQYDGWVDRAIGDDESNPIPSFVQDGETIKDIFFFKNRLGFITSKNLVASEVGQYGNFFRTTVVALLDSDRIDTAVDSNKAINLEYVTYLQDALMLFSDKAQFRVAGDRVFSPKSVQVSQASAYEMNKNIRPIYSNDKIFFCAIRGDYTAVMQYSVDVNSNVSTAVDITSHVEQYIPSDVVYMSDNPINNMLILFAKSEPSLLYVYKYMDNGDQRIQSAWFKWRYNGSIYAAFSLGKNLNILINRYDKSVATNWVLGDGIWRGDKLWDFSKIWVGSPDDLVSVDNFEVQELTPIQHTGYFVDASEFVDTTEVSSLTGTATSSILSYTEKIVGIKTGDIYIYNGSVDIVGSYTITAHIKDEKTGTITQLSATDDRLVVPRDALALITQIDIEYATPSGNVFNGIFVLNADMEIIARSGMFEYGNLNWTYTNWTENYKQIDEGAIIRSRVDLGEWVYGKVGSKLHTGNMKMKSCIVSSEDESDFDLEIKYTDRQQGRTIKAKHLVDKRPIIFGDSKKTRLAIISDTDKGFKINSVTLEGNYNARDRRA